MVKPPVKRTYHARADGWVAGRRVEKGQAVELTAAEARYEPVELVASGPAAQTRRRPAAEAPSP